MTTTFWQEFAPDAELSAPYTDRYRVRVGARSLDLPLRALPDGKHAVSSLLVNHASFGVLDAIVEDMSRIALEFAPEVIVGVPTLGLTLAPGVARACGHARYVPLSTSRKFWYRDDVSVPLTSITSPGNAKSLYLDPNLLPLLQEKRVLLVDDVVSTGTSLAATIALLGMMKIEPVGVVCAMTQTNRWRARVSVPVSGSFSSPLFVRNEGQWVPDFTC
ncbi:phosphoribosyltransferase [Gluconobacter wancherniae]|uniref:phosphoribosyltransferase n=1 Tax=Gluconobacter wancherniae TaxID=1307955 RepID=UPI001B8C3650|nr:phosphoribosyltransferase [Gluconobacter wancherniae]MBS1062461.1 phosphoribosyltransferase [Gluconobacter wancherniae]